MMTTIKPLNQCGEKNMCKDEQLCDLFEAANMPKWRKSTDLHVEVLMHVNNASKIYEPFLSVVDTHLLSEYKIDLKTVAYLLHKSGWSYLVVSARLFWFENIFYYDITVEIHVEQW